jgi:hypothetical protein
VYVREVSTGSGAVLSRGTYSRAVYGGIGSSSVCAGVLEQGWPAGEVLVAALLAAAAALCVSECWSSNDNSSSGNGGLNSSSSRWQQWSNRVPTVAGGMRGSGRCRRQPDEV